jgi:hypothetical protein
VPNKHATSLRGTGLDPFGPAVRSEQRLGTRMTHFVSSWTGMTQQHNFEDRSCILLFFLLLNRRGLPPTDYKFILKGTGSYNILLRNKERNEKKKLQAEFLH